MKAVSHWCGFPFLVLWLASCATSATATLDEWVRVHGSEGGKPLCATELNEEYFFLFKSGNEVRIGSRVDLTEYPAAGIVAWRFRDEKGRDLTAKKPPVVLRSEHIREGSKRYGETVELQSLRDDDPGSIEVTAQVKKCSAFECDHRNTREREVSYIVKVCVVKLRP